MEVENIFNHFGINPSRYCMGDECLSDYYWNRKEIGLTINSACNLKCPYCINKDPPVTGNMSVDMVKKIAKWASTAKIQPMCCILGGEPLIHPEFNTIAEIMHNATSATSVLTNGTIPITKILPISYQLTLHDDQTNDRQIKGFIKNLDILASNDAIFEVYLTFTDAKQLQVYNWIVQNKLTSHLRQIRIDVKYTEKKADNIYRQGFIINDKKISNDDFIKYKMYAFKDWQCLMLDFNILADGTARFHCLNDVVLPFEEIDLNKDYFVTCPLKYCDRECRFGTLKYKK